ncbi:MAG: hypothetical protein LBU89_14775 [Fibromonadaceae bacterium]|jgi:hypothetical protein|nr:hypothetical protein [Fibromonadaceae bacterium]
MKRLLHVITLVLLLSGSAFSDIGSGLELNLGLSSPNKGLLGVRFVPVSAWSFGLILGSFSSYFDVGIAGSFHFSGQDGAYVYHSHHLLNSKVGNLWEINTGGGYQRFFTKNFLAYAEAGIPIYIGGWKVWRFYKEGRPYSRDEDNDAVLISLRAGLGVGYVFELW